MCKLNNCNIVPTKSRIVKRSRIKVMYKVNISPIRSKCFITAAMTGSHIAECGNITQQRYALEVYDVKLSRSRFKKMNAILQM